jgi:hypothetical protein
MKKRSGVLFHLKWIFMSPEKKYLYLWNCTKRTLKASTYPGELFSSPFLFDIVYCDAPGMLPACRQAGGDFRAFRARLLHGIDRMSVLNPPEKQRKLTQIILISVK